MNHNYSKPVNLGNPDEYKIHELATIIRDLIGNENRIVEVAKVEDDPKRRRPDISTAAEQLNWKPKTNLLDGLRKTIGYFKNELSKNKNDKNSQESYMHRFYYASHDEKDTETTQKNEL